MFRRSLPLPLLILLPLASLSAVAGARIPYSGGLHRQDFDGLPASGGPQLAGTGTPGTQVALPGLPGWQAARIGGSATSAITLATSPSTTGRLYSYGHPDSPDRALGSLASGTTVAAFGVSFTNRSNQTFHSLHLRYARELWTVQGTSGSQLHENRLRFAWGLSRDGIGDMTYLTDPRMSAEPALDAVAPAEWTITSTSSGTDPDRQRDGNQAPWREIVEHRIDDITWQPGETLYLRWSDFDQSGFDAGLAVDDFEFFAQARPRELALEIASSSPLALAFPSVPGRSYLIERSADMIDWRGLSAEPLRALDARGVLAPDATPPRGFFRGWEIEDSPAWQEAFFTRPGPRGTEADLVLEEKVRELLALAKPGSQVRAAIYTWSRTEMAEAFIQASLRGVDVRIVLGSDYPATRLLTELLPPGHVVTCRNPSGEIGGCLGGSINHNKFILFSELADGSRDVVVQSSANFTQPQIVNGNNLVVLRNDPALHSAYLSYWQDMAAQRRNLSYYRQAEGMVGTRVHFFPRANGDGITGNNDTIVEILSQLRPGPETRIRVAMAFWTGPRRAIANRLAAFHHSGSDVAVIVNPNETSAVVLGILEGAGVPVIRFTPTHSKVMLIEGEFRGRPSRVVLTGSHNYTGPALTSNDETLLELHSQALFEVYLEDWERMRDHPLAR